MLKRFIQQITRLLVGNSVTASDNSRLPVPHRDRTNGQSNGVYSRHRQDSNRGFHRREPEVGYRHNAERLLRDGHFRIAITGFSDTAFNINVMSRHNSPQLALAVSDLPCKIKMVDQRNIAAGLLGAIKTLDDSSPGRRGIVLITSGNAASGQDQLQQLAAKAAGLRIGIHVICLGIRPDDPIGAPRISTKGALGYGSLRMVESADQLSAAIRDAFQGLTPAFGMHGTNKAVILLDCSEAMVEAYRDSTRIDMVISALGEFLKAPLVRSCSSEQDNRSASRFHAVSQHLPVSWQYPATGVAAEACDWSPRSI